MRNKPIGHYAGSQSDSHFIHEMRTEIVFSASAIEDGIHWNALPEDKMSKDTIMATGTVDFQRAITLLEGILTRMKEGKLVFGAENNTIEITPSDRVELDIQAQDTDGVQGFSFGLKWTESKEELQAREEPLVSRQESPACSLNVEEACACEEDDFELAFLKEAGFFQPTTCSM